MRPEPAELLVSIPHLLLGLRTQVVPRPPPRMLGHTPEAQKGSPGRGEEKQQTLSLGLAGPTHSRRACVGETAGGLGPRPTQ